MATYSGGVTMCAPILFLDFDGVLHPYPYKREQAFAAVPLLLAVLEDFPSVDVVVSSSWRLLRYSRAWLQVPEALRERITGHTPEIRRREHGMHTVALQPLRQAEILRYLADSGGSERSWVALDDDERLFSPECPNLILCREGFGEAEAIKLRLRLG